MKELQQLQKQVKTVGSYLYNKDITPPNTVEECKRKLNFYYFAYGVNYSKVIMSETK
jgi:hypothetical protein